jgi:phosphate acetyltransferase
MSARQTGSGTANVVCSSEDAHHLERLPMDPLPFLSSTQPTVPHNLLDQARRLPVPRVALVNAGSEPALRGLQETVEAGLAEPILVGDPRKIAETAERIGWNITGVPVVDAPHHNAAPAAVELVRAGGADALMKGQIHTSTFLLSILPSAQGLRAPGVRCGHIMHITMPGSERPLLLTDAALNVAPDMATRQACLTHAVRLAQKLGIDRPKAGLLAPSEDPTPSVPHSLEDVAITEWAKTALPDAVVHGPMAMDLILSRRAAEIKGFVSEVAGDADIIVVPEITSGNAIFKLMSLCLGCCCAGVVLGAKVPIILTSRAQGAADRLASAALAAVGCAR